MRHYVIKNAQGEVTSFGTGYETDFSGGTPEGFEVVDTPYMNMSQPVTKLLTKLDFMQRFTDAELEAIYTAAATTVPVTIWLDKFKLASTIDVADQRTIDGINMLKNNGLLTTQRAAFILSA